MTIEGAPGLAGWSDADVVCHALIDALLGAAGLGDIGEHFPADAVPEGVSSLDLLIETRKRLAAANFEIVNADVVVIAQEVRIRPFREEIAGRLATALSVEPSSISVKGTTTDRLGFTGRGEGIAAMAVALLEGA